MQESNEDSQLLQAKLTTETAKIPWRELQRYFAMGRAIQVAGGIDLVRLAVWITQDRSGDVQALMDRREIGPVSDDQARDWFDADASVWAVVVRPWVLVQSVADRADRQQAASSPG
jgi:hypothetical protein